MQGPVWTCTWDLSLKVCAFEHTRPPAWQGERRIRGTAIYPQASLLNHECLPNVARFDDFDSPQLRAPHNTAVRPHCTSLTVCPVPLCRLQQHMG